MTPTLARDITAFTAAFGVTAVVSRFITSTTTSDMRLPIKAAVIIGAFVVGAVAMDASRSGVGAQFDEIIDKVKSLKKN